MQKDCRKFLRVFLHKDGSEIVFFVRDDVLVRAFPTIASLSLSESFLSSILKLGEKDIIIKNRKRFILIFSLIAAILSGYLSLTSLSHSE